VLDVEKEDDSMNTDSTLPELSELSLKLGQLIRSDELKICGKLLAMSRSHLKQLAEKEPMLHVHYDQVAQLRNRLLDPAGVDFNGKQLLVGLLEEEEALRKVIDQHPHELSHHAHVLLKAAAAIVLVYCQDSESGAPLDF